MSLRAKLQAGLIIGFLAVLVIGITYLAFFDIPVTTAKVEKVVPDDRFPK